MANMASPVTTTIFAACFGLLVMVVAAHEGHQHTPGMAMSPEPAPESMGNHIVSPTTVIGSLSLIVTILVGGGHTA
ncbi:hypothetical protein PTKIN_Ptkin17bG0075400 [Pterospermum kingtungense]